MDIRTIREGFPILAEKIYGHDLIYFDNAATTQKPACVLARIQEAYAHVNANIHRGVHYLSQKATQAHEDARLCVADFLHAASASEIVFTRGTTESINLIASSFGEAYCRKGDEIILTTMEHHSNIVPWQMLAERKGIVLKVVPLLPDGSLDLATYEALFSDHTRLVSVAHVSNVLGTVNPVSELIKTAHSHKVPVLLDGAQAVSHLSVDVHALDADFYVFSGHKIYGPTGIGVLYGKKALLEKLPPYQGGGEMIQNVTFAKTTYNGLPYKFEAGTPDFIGSTALAEALRYVRGIGMENISKHEHGLLSYATARLLEVDGMRIIGTAPEKSGVVSFLVDGVHPYDLGMLLDKLGIAVRTGHHCAQPLMDSLGIVGTVRASFALYNTKEEIDAFMVHLKRAVDMLR